jgi:hypothetical protein
MQAHTATIAEVVQIRDEALARVADKTLPLEVRIRSKETVALCDERMMHEGRKR